MNRAGLPLMELVFEPDLEDGEEAAALVKELCAILLRLGTCSCKMEGPYLFNKNQLNSARGTKIYNFITIRRRGISRRRQRICK